MDAEMARKTIDKTEWDKKVPGLGPRSRNGRQSWIVQRRVDGLQCGGR